MNLLQTKKGNDFGSSDRQRVAQGTADIIILGRTHHL